MIMENKQNNKINSLNKEKPLNKEIGSNILSEEQSKIIVLKPLSNESNENNSSIKNNIEVHIKPKLTKSDNSVNAHTKADTVIRRKKNEKLTNTGKYIPKKINTSMLLLRDLAFDPHCKDLPGLNKTTPCQIVTMEYQAKLFEEMVEIWIEKETEIIFKLKGIWGIDQIGLCTSDGYFNKIENTFPLCSLLGRIGSQDCYFQIKNNMKLPSEISGPLFLLMNISADFILANKYTLSGSVAIEIQNAKKYSFAQIYKKLTFNEEPLVIFYNDLHLKDLFSRSELSVIILINQIRLQPDLCLKYYFPTDFILSKEIRESATVCSLIKPNEILKKVAEEAMEDSSFENRIVKYNIDNSYSSIKEFQIKTPTKNLSEILLKLIKAENSFVFNSTTAYVGLSIRPMNQIDGNMTSYLSVFVYGE